MLVKKYISPFLCIILLSILTVNAQQVMYFVKEGLIMCYERVIPSLYIFMVLSNYIADSNMIYFFSLPFRWFSELIKIKDKQFSAYLFLSLLGGFAVGANFMKKLEESGYDKNALKIAATAMTGNSFSFIVLAVGTGYLGNTNIGLMLFLSLMMANLITAFLMSFIYEYNIVVLPDKATKQTASLVKSINSAVNSIISICGFVILFHCLCEVISLYINNKSLYVLFNIIMEVTSGCAKIIEIYGKNPYILCFCLSIMPVSTLCQVYHFTLNKSIIKTLLISRVVHTPVSLLILSLLTNIFPVAAAVSGSNTIAIKTYQQSAELSSVLFLITVIFLYISDENRLFTKNR